MSDVSSKRAEVVIGKEPKRAKMTNRVRLLILVALLFIATLLFIAYRLSVKSGPESIDGLLRASTDDNGRAKVAGEYGARYDSSLQDLRSVDIQRGDKVALDKVYFTLVYADKIGAFSQVYEMLSLLDSAKSKGVNIDDNSYAITEKTRNEILQRADAKAKEVKDGQSKN